ncbi:MAG: hypothetical protein AAF611_02435 [Bacteroidota bacterium]
MKKRSIKSLELNKKIISTLDSAELKGGSTVSTNVTVYTPVVPILVDQAIDEIVDAYEYITDLF